MSCGSACLLHVEIMYKRSKRDIRLIWLYYFLNENPHYLLNLYSDLYSVVMDVNIKAPGVHMGEIIDVL